MLGDYEHVMASIGSNVNILDTDDESIVALAGLAVKVREPYIGPEGPALVRLIVEYDSQEGVYQRIADVAQRYDKLLETEGLNARLALENTHHSINEWREIAGAIDQTKRIGWTFDPGNFATRDYSSGEEPPGQHAIMHLAADYRHLIYAVHLKQVFQGNALTTIKRYNGNGYSFSFDSLLYSIRNRLNYKGSLYLEPTAARHAEVQLRHSMCNLPILQH